MPWIFSCDGKSLDLENLSLDDYIDVEAATGVAWYEIATSPIRNARVAKLIAEKCAAATGVTLPPLTAKSIVGLFTLDREPNRPDEYQDGMPDPKAPATDPATS